jgi:hypothetical protein
MRKELAGNPEQDLIPSNGTHERNLHEESRHGGGHDGVSPQVWLELSSQ